MTTTLEALESGDRWWPAATPFGEMLLVGDDEALHELLLPNATAAVRADLPASRRARPAAVEEAETQLGQYCAGERREFELRLEPFGTAFQRSVWWALADIPYGSTATYGEVAARVGRPRAFRAVGMTNGRNPLPVVLPCHRVIGAGGRLVGYGGGLELKRRLLDHERAVLAGSLP